MKGVFEFSRFPLQSTYMENILIRHAQEADALWIARVQVRTWQSAYAGLIHQDYLDVLDIWKKTEQWWWKIKINWRLIFVAEYREEIIWFISGWESREKEKYDGEIMAFYVLKEYQWNWIGTGLFEAMKIEFKGIWYNSFYLWVLHNWPARKFYEKIWGIYIDEKKEKIGDIEVVEVSYGWKNIE